MLLIKNVVKNSKSFSLHNNDAKIVFNPACESEINNLECKKYCGTSNNIYRYKKVKNMFYFEVNILQSFLQQCKWIV